MLTVTQLNSMSVQDLLKLNAQLIIIVKEKQRLENRVATVSFMAGDQVKYQGKFGPMTGKVLEVKRTKVVVESTRGRFLVPAAMLSKA
jgi:hypothetical protein